MATKSAAEKLAELEAEMSKLASRARAIKAQQSSENRKLETRRAIVVGQWLMRHDRESVARIVAELARPQDRALFQNWAPPSASSGEPAGNG